MNESEKTPALDKNQEIEWDSYNYPPLLKIIHYVPAEIPSDKRFIVLSLFALHICSIGVCLINFVDNCIEGGLGVLYSILFMLIFIPLMFYIFYRGMTGICRKEASLKIYFILQPIVIILEIVISIVDFLGFNGFIRAADMFQQGRGGAGFMGLVVSIIFLAMAIYSAFILVKIFRGRKGFKDSVI